MVLSTLTKKVEIGVQLAHKLAHKRVLCHKLSFNCQRQNKNKTKVD